MPLDNLLVFPNKKIRSQVIKNYINGFGLNNVVCFSCGNASRELKEVGVNTLDISPIGDFNANRWFTSADIAALFPDRFNATSGYLPFDLMYKIGLAYKDHLGDLTGDQFVPTGSGETLICLSLVYPTGVNFIAVYDNANPATTFDQQSPLYPLIKRVSKNIIIRSL